MYVRLCIWCVCITFVQLAIVCDCNVNVGMRMLLAKFWLRLHNVDVISLTPTEAHNLKSIHSSSLLLLPLPLPLPLPPSSIQVTNAEKKRDTEGKRRNFTSWPHSMEPLAILSTFELVLSCILTLLHLIEQSHIAGHYASFALPLLATLSHSHHFFASKISL